MTSSVCLDLALVALLAAAFWAAPALARPTLPFGVRVPAARMAEPEIIRAHHRYARGVLVVGTLAFVLVAFASAGLRWESAAAFVAPVLAAACCGLGYREHRRVAAAKRDGDWYSGTRQAVAADTSLRTDPVRPQWILLAPAAALFAITAAIGAWRYGALPATLPTPNGMIVDPARRSETTVGHAFATVTAQLLIIVLVGLLGFALPRARPELDAAQPAASAARYRGYLAGVLRLLFGTAGCAAASLLVASLEVWEIVPATTGATVVSYLPLAAAAIAWVAFAFRAGDAGHRLPADEEDSGRVQRDDDRYWRLAGMVYVNRGDPALLVHRRSGVSWTLNLGNPISWAILGALAAFAALAGFGVVELPSRGG
ncbi:DUF1648 domain-containing protein [Amycolatopsis dendrobii]|uniref:DUF5808 domain-containing protein n=1 Tax=Amycolatopsis dendrobii TaxID=2760662 RepID=A0A7W3ZBL1_9PSEU|nr:DUF5808 domain-containing protein [Amycolatopsis dendrobii]MBB1154962.1 hypothetical protein [Amycolatopsis dendrobii]